MPTRQQLLKVIHIQTEIAKLGLDLAGVMDLVVEQCLALLGADGAAIELAEDGQMVYRAAAGIARGQLGLRLDIQSSLSGLCVRTGKVMECRDASNDPRVDRAACEQVGLRSMLLVPLHHRGAPVGVLKAMSTRVAAFGQRERRLLDLLCDVVAASMYYATQFDRDRLFFAATHDSLTGLANRAQFMDRLRNALARTARDRTPTGVLMIDMDGLKPLNDGFGHRAGDAALVELAQRLRRSSRDCDTVARLGGDEFGLVLTALDGSEGLERVVERIQEELEGGFEFEAHRHPLGASIGTALAPVDGTDPIRLLDLADQRMYSLKRSRKRMPAAVGATRHDRAGDVLAIARPAHGGH